MITATLLRDHGACEPQVVAFERAFPGGIDLSDTTRDAEIIAAASAAQLHFDWAAAHLLTPTARRAFDEAIAPALRAYNRATAAARRAFDEATAAARRAYDEAIATALRAFAEARATALLAALRSQHLETP